MRVTGRFHNIGYTQDRKMLITFEVEEQNKCLDEADAIKDEKLLIDVVKYREKRSLNANAYFHILIGKIADALTSIGSPTSKSNVKNRMITSYGQQWMLDDGEPFVYKTNAPPEFMQEREEIHAKFIKQTDAYFYLIYRGSSTYNTKEMSLLIEGTIQEAKELGIETMTPNEIAEMMAHFGKEKE